MRSVLFRSFFLPTLLFATLLLASAGLSGRPSFARHTQTNSPSIDRVEPPSWWLGSNVNPVRILLHGQNLRNATATVTYPGVSVTDVHASATGTYLFLSLRIDAATRPGTFPITIAASSHSSTASFTILAPPSSEDGRQGFGPDDVIYLIMPDRFSDGDQSNNEPPESPGLSSRSNPRGYHGGDLQGVIDRLPYLKDLGVTAIWMTPVYDNSNRARDFDFGKNVTDYHGYGAVNYYRVEEHLGSLEKLQELVSRAHAMGLKIVQDQVPNHTGPDHPWTTDAPSPFWLNGTLANHLNNPFDIRSLTIPSGDPVRAEATLRGWFAGALPDINQDDEEAAQYEIENSMWWAGVAGIDGVRLDTFPYVPRSFWAKWNVAMQAEFPRMTAVGEVLDGNPEAVSFFQGGQPRFDQIDTRQYSVFDYPSYFAIRDVFIKGQSMQRLSDVLAQDRLYTNPAVLVTFLGNHDTTRFMSEPGSTSKKLLLAFSFLLTMRGIPQIYYGDEIGTPGQSDPDNRRDFPGGFPGDRRDGFTESGRTKKERKIFTRVRNLLQLRAARPALRTGEMRVLEASEDTFAFLRESGGDRILVALNKSGRPARLDISVPGSATASAAGQRSSIWKSPWSDGWSIRESEGKIRLSIPPLESLILVNTAR